MFGSRGGQRRLGRPRANAHPRHRLRARGRDPEFQTARLLARDGEIRDREGHIRRHLSAARFQEERRRARPRSIASGITPRPRRSSPPARASRWRRCPRKRKASTQIAPRLYDLTTLQREANGRFGFSAKRTLQIAQALYEKHKMLTYPRTDSRALPEDYLPVVRQTLGNLGGSLQAHAQKVLEKDWVKLNKRIFNNAQISDHFAIIPTTSEAKHLDEAEAKIFDMVARRFVAVFYPAAEFDVTTRLSQVAAHKFKTEGKVLTAPGWLEVYGRTHDRRFRQEAKRCRRLSAEDQQPGENARSDAAYRSDQAAAALHRGDAPLRDGNRGQIRRGRRREGSDEGTRPGHAGDARRHDRRVDLPEIHRSQSARIGARPQRPSSCCNFSRP